MNCAGFAQSCWEELDGRLAPEAKAALDGHRGRCAACRAYAAKARRLHGLLPSAFAPAPEPDFAPAVAAGLRADRDRREFPAIGAALAAAAASLILVCAAERFGIDAWSAGPAALDWPAKTAALPGAWSFFVDRSSAVPFAISVPTLSLAAGLWILTMREAWRTPGVAPAGRQ